MRRMTLGCECLEDRRLLDATLVLSELMASNQSVVADEDGDYSDWIELHNAASESVNLGGYYLTDDPDVPTKWAFPDTEIDAGGFQLVFASGKDRDNPGGQLHTNFKLNAGGEYLALIQPDGTTVAQAYAPEYPPQVPDVSYGLASDLSTQGFFLTPTPGLPNAAEPIADPARAVVVSEIMYHPASENELEEYVELFNRGLEPVDVGGWQLDDAVQFTLPERTILPGEYLVVAADQGAFAAKYPTVANVVGGWTGRLSNHRETIDLVDDSGVLVDRVTYADQGDWAVRAEGPLDHNSRGWVWFAEHDGGGKSLELINHRMPNEYGQNWGSSTTEQGTPGAANSIAATDTAPLILDVMHGPAIPHSTDPVTVTARVVDETPGGMAVALYWRVDGQPAFNVLAMADDGLSGDGQVADGVFAATIPAQPDGTVVEFYVAAGDSLGHLRTWPAPTQPSGLQQTNLLYQVLDAFDATAEWVPGSPVVYHEIMTTAERNEFTNINRASDAQMNATFISVTGTGIEVRYNAGIRIRGSGSRNHNPPNNRINLPSDRPWHGVDALNINAVTIQDQIAGSALFHLAGLPAADAKPVMLLSNGVNLNNGRPYAHLEPLKQAFVSNHFPLDNNGNLYKGRRPNESPPGGQGAGLVYFGPDPAPYVSYTKLTNASAADWSDVINLTYQLNETSDQAYLDAVTQVVDVDQWLRFFALNALLDNNEGGLVNGDRQGDDYAMYRGVDDPRFRMIIHDLDTLFGRTTRDFFRATNVPALNRLIRHPAFLPRYYGQLIDLIENVLLTDRARTTLGEALRGVISPAQIDGIMTFLENRAQFVLSRIPRELTIDSGLPTVGEFPQTTSPVLLLSGTAHAAETGSVLVAGRPVDSLPGDGTWAITGSATGGGSETIISTGSTWKYLDDGSDQGTAWRDPQFDDTGWAAGPAPLGYGDGNEATVVGYIDTTPENPGSVTKNATTYFRSTFQVTDPTSIATLNIHMRYDDAAAVYINGVEATRTNNLSAGAVYDTYSVIDTPNENGFFDFAAAPAAVAALIEGDNTIAVEIHQGDAFSSDIKLDLELTATREAEVTDGIVLNPGINRIPVETFAGPRGTGARLQSDTIDVWYNGPAATTTVAGPVAEVDRLELAVRDSYLPGTPLLVRVEARDAQDEVQRNLWNAVVTLETDRSDIRLSSNEITLVNGLGSALVDVTGTGDFTLTARLGQRVVRRTLISLQDVPETTAGGTLTEEMTTWSGIVHVTDHVTVPAGHTLTIQPGTLVLLDGDPVGTSNSTSLIVDGSLQSLGTASRPVTLTALESAEPWGQVYVRGGSASFQHTMIHRAGNAPHLGHTSSGAALRVAAGGRFDFADGSISDLRGKIMQSTSGTVTFTRALLTRAVMGPEIQDTALAFTDSWIVEMAGVYHVDGTVDDNDGIYLHGQQAGQSIELLRGVIANTQDDGIDTLGAVATINDTIVRDIVDKAVSTFNGEVRIARSLLVSADIGVNTKGQGTSTPHTTLDRTTIADVNHGIVAQDKDAPDPNVVITFDVTNSIIWVRPGGDAVSTDYDPADIHIDYSNVAEAWPGTGNLNQDPLFYNPAAGDYRLQPGSPSVDAGDPTAAADPDGSRADQGALDNGVAGVLAPQTLAAGTLTEDTILAPYGGPYHVTGDLVVAPGVRMTVLPGTSIYFDQGVELTVRGALVAVGTPYQRIRLTSVPNAPFVPDLPGLPDGPPRWSGVHFVDSMDDANTIAYADIDYAQDSGGAIGVVRSEVFVDHVTWRGTHRRMIYANQGSVTVRNSVFPDMFAANESPLALGLDNVSEHIKADGGIPAGGHFIIQNNRFGTNKGHNDVIDVVSGQRPGPIVQILDNVFAGSGDELIDLGGDAYVAGNLMMNVHKDDDSSDHGYANAISTGDGPTGTTIAVARNVFWNVDHAINLRRDTATVFENNTVVGVHDDFIDRFGNLNVNSAINLYVDEPGGQPGAGAYVAGNIFQDAPRIFGNADLPAGTVSSLVLNFNIVSAQLAETKVGSRPGTVLDLGVDNLVGDAWLADASEGDFALRPGSPASMAGPLRGDLGAAVPAGIWVEGEPPSRTSSTAAVLTVGGPGIYAFRYRVDGGPWSEPATIGTGFDPVGGTVRTAQITLTGLADGDHRVEVLGQDFAGTWQEEPTATPTWTVDTASARVRINEVLASNQSAVEHAGTFPDVIELFNDGAQPVNLGGMSLSDKADKPTRFVFPPGTLLAPNGYLTIYADTDFGTPGLHAGFSLDGTGEGLYLFAAAANGGGLVDAVVFGIQVPDLSIGRVGHDAHWALTQPTLGGANVAQPTGDPATLSINEWFANGDVRLVDDFLELFNPDPMPVAMAGMFLSDKPDAVPDRFEFAPLSFIAGNGQASLIADGHPERGANHLSFKLSADQELLALFDTAGAELDRVLYYPQTTDVSQGRDPDGGINYAFFHLPTPGLPTLQPISSTTVVDLDWNAVWRYDDSGTDLGTTWRAPDFDDAAWSSGPGLLGLDVDPLPEPIITPLEIGRVTHYFRKHFTLDVDPSAVTAQLRTIIDDGAVIYVNGHEITRLRLPAGELSFGTTAGTVVVATVEGPFDIPADFLVQGDNVVAVELHQNGAGSADAVFGLSLQVTAQVLNPAVAQALALLDDLRVTEVMYNPAEDSGVEYIELQNMGVEPLSLDGVRLAGGIDFTFPPMVLEPNDRVVVTEDQAEFQALYGSGKNVAGQYTGKLGNGGDQIVVLLPEPYAVAVLRFKFRDDWYPATDGGGFALEIRDPLGRPASWSDSASWQAGTVMRGTPGYEAGSEPAPTVLVNEVLTHTDPPAVDAIELRNVTSQAIDIGGWFLSDSASNYRKFMIPADTTILAGGFVVFDESDFNASGGADPNDFALSGAHGDQVWLWQGDGDGHLARLADFVQFGAAANGEAFGRWPDGTGLLAPMMSVTLGQENSGPRIGPVVITELNYHPSAPSAAALAVDPDLDRGDLEFVEITNTTAGAIDLADWQLRSGVDFDLKDGTTIRAGQALVIVSFDPEAAGNANRVAAFRTHYGIDESTGLVGGFSGHLSNDGERVRLLRPDQPPATEPEFIPRLLEDDVRYDDEPPWPVAADGGGMSLTRTNLFGLGTLASSWSAAAPSPGQATLPLVGDVNGDNEINGLDVAPFADILLGHAYLFTADVNRDGFINGLDVRPFVMVVLGEGPPIPGDVNGDGQVNGLDVNPFVDVLLTSTFHAAADVNQDGQVNGLDVQPFVAAVVGANSVAAEGDLAAFVPIPADSFHERTVVATAPATARNEIEPSRLVRHLDPTVARRVLARRNLPLGRSGQYRFEATKQVADRLADQSSARVPWRVAVDRVFGDAIEWRVAGAGARGR